MIIEELRYRGLEARCDDPPLAKRDNIRDLARRYEKVHTDILAEAYQTWWDFMTMRAALRPSI
jgi:hypothetical protein